MNLAQLEILIAAYHQKDVSDLTINGIDMFLMTVNSIRRKAELKHNFDNCRCRATLNVDGVTGGRLDDAVIYDPPSELEVTSAASGVSGTYTQIELYNSYWRYTNGTHHVFYDPNRSSYVLTDSLTNPTIVWKNDSTTADGTYVDVLEVAANATVEIVNDFESVRELVACQITQADGSMIPVDLTLPDVAIERDRYELELSNAYWPANRYPSDAQRVTQLSDSTLVQRNRKLFIHPPDTQATTSNPLLLYAEAYAFLHPFDATDLDIDAATEDFMLTIGFDWLKWATIYELNPLFHTFVPRQEGNVGNDPKVILSYREEAWRDLLINDAYQVSAHSTRSR